MKRVLFAVALAAYALIANADCTMNTIYGPDGTVKFCTTCCDGGFCTTRCN